MASKIESNLEAGSREGRERGALAGSVVTFGPPLVFDLLAATSVVATAVGALSPPRRGRGSTFLRTLAAFGSVSSWAYVLGIRPWIQRWGATDDEARRPLPGDELVPHPVGETTRAITIEALAADVWPWLVQIGYGRGGWYSYDFLEAAAGVGDFLEGRSAERIIPELQQLKVGDRVPLGRGVDMRVAIVEPARALVLQALFNPFSGRPVDPKAPGREPYMDWSWAFVLEPAGTGATRLIIRTRSDLRPRRSLELLAALFVELPHWIMERKMLLGIKQRAEHAPEGGRETLH